MERFTLETSPRIWHQANSANQTADVTSLSPSATSPIHGTGAISSKNMNLAKLIFWGAKTLDTSADNLDYFVRLYGWSNVSAQDLWIPTFICKINVIMGTAVGVAAKYPDATDYFADQITLIEGDTSVRIITDTTNNIASITVDLEGADYLGVAFDGTGATSEPDEYGAMVGLI